MSVIWLDRARTKIRQREIIPQFDKELELAFQNDPAAQITVCDVFRGYRTNETEKVVLGVQVKHEGCFGSHIVKLGSEEKVQRDHQGWENCLLKHSLASRVLMAVKGRALPKRRYAAIYEDAYQLFGTDPDYESPKPLEKAFELAVKGSEIDPRSVDRVIVEIFSDLNRCLYRDGQEDRKRAAEYYAEELKKAGETSAWQRWEADSKYRQLRRDALWLVTARQIPDTESLPEYLDPFDFIAWALETSSIPETMTGRSHGDLHGRNVIVGLNRGDALQPAIFDYGDMNENNILVWDFVKLEMEMKCRLLPGLFYAADAREKLQDFVHPVRPAIAGMPHLQADELETAQRADRLEFAFEFEIALAKLTREINSSDVAAKTRSGQRATPIGHQMLDRALCIILRIRQEAAYWLGFEMSRSALWRDEYYFALAVYGLLTAKWSVEEPHLEWAIVSAGVAVAQFDYQVESGARIKDVLQQLHHQTQTEYPEQRLPTHFIPLAWAHRQWRHKRHAQACELLEKAGKQFPHAVSLLQEHALCLAAKGDQLGAKREISSLQRLCHIFGDYETLCRLGRILKDSGDDAWKVDRPKFRDFIFNNHSGCQLYKDAQKLYAEAFQFSRHYYPGVNAATLAFLAGDTEGAKTIAADVLNICVEQSVADMEERYWIYATEGEASLVADNKKKAISFYEQALRNPCAQSKGMLQPLYDQLCRLHWALGSKAVRPILKIMEGLGLLANLDPGPFENCGRG